MKINLEIQKLEYLFINYQKKEKLLTKLMKEKKKLKN